MRTYKFHCGICGKNFSSARCEPANLYPACPVCGETRRLYIFRGGFKRLFYGSREARFYDFSGEVEYHYIPEDSAYQRRGCSRIPTCCGLATPCDNPPCSECECELEHRLRFAGV